MERASLKIMNHAERAQGFAAEMWEWFGRRKRTLPWRDLRIENDTQRAYMILVSEVMLQQTQVSRVQVIFKQFLEKFPTLRDLAAASNSDVIIAWKGMGYNSRALRLRDAARIVTEEHSGVFPRELEELLAIKGIGAYTAAAIRNFAFGIPTPCVDTNIHRILHRVFESPEPEKINTATARKVLGFAEDSLKIALEQGKGDTKDWHAALMDFGSLVCKKSVPLCEQCPMAGGICKSAFKIQKAARKAPSKEPGRMVGATFIPNRIFRGRVVDLLREQPSGLTLEQIGAGIASDWASEHIPWLEGLLQKLAKDDMIEKSALKYRLRS